jgi:hypothetical protein
VPHHLPPRILSRLTSGALHPAGLNYDAAKVHPVQQNFTGSKFAKQMLHPQKEDQGTYVVG